MHATDHALQQGLALSRSGNRIPSAGPAAPLAAKLGGVDSHGRALAKAVEKILER